MTLVSIRQLQEPKPGWMGIGCLKQHSQPWLRVYASGCKLVHAIRQLKAIVTIMVLRVSGLIPRVVKLQRCYNPTIILGRDNSYVGSRCSF